MYAENLKNLDWPHIVQKLEEFATSESAREDIREITPLNTIAEAQKSFARIHEAQQILALGSRPSMESLDLCGVWLERLKKKATLKTIDLKDVRLFLIETQEAQESCQPFNSEWIEHIKGQLMDSSEPLSAIDHFMTPNGEIRTDASETLFNLHKEKLTQNRAVQNILASLVKQHEMEPLLQDKFVTTREGRCVLPVKSGMQHQLSGIIHASSQSKQTVFMEPKEVIPLNNRLREVEIEIEDEIQRLLSEISLYLHRQWQDIALTRDILKEMDRTLSEARLATALDAIPAEFTEDIIEFNGLRHPSLVLNQDEVIPNDVRLQEDQGILLLSGPNAGGKTVLLKAIGLAAHMARCGLLVCANEKARIPFFREIMIAIGDAQNVDDHLSTFAAHLKVLDEATQIKGSDCLLLMDEICGSTDPEEGSALARSFLEKYAENGVFAVITSHLGPLKIGWPEDSRVINGSMEYDSSTGNPTYHFVKGIAGQSLALQTAKRVGVPAAILDRAMELLSPETKAQHRGLSEIEELREGLAKIKKELNHEKFKTQKEQIKYEKLIEEFNQNKETKIKKAMTEAETKVDEMIRQVKVADVFSRHEKLENIKTELPKIVKHQAGKRESDPVEILSAAEFAERFPPGSAVFIPSIGRDGVVQGQPNAKGEIPILSQSMRVAVSWKTLQPPRSQAPGGRRRAVQVALTGGDRTVDLRGMRVDPAIEQLEVQLDAAAVNSEDRLKIIHGHGTDALKKAVRAYLSRSMYVHKWTAGGSETGGDGITWAEIKEQPGEN